MRSQSPPDQRGRRPRRSPSRTPSPFNRRRRRQNSDRSNYVRPSAERPRSRSPGGRRGGRSKSPSPPVSAATKRRKQLANIRITTPNRPDVAEKTSRTRLMSKADADGPVFKGPDDGCLVNMKEQKKIQIEIRRKIPSDRVSKSPVRRSVRDHATVFVTRKPEEGATPIFDRDEIKLWIPDVPEQRVVAMVTDRRSSRSPPWHHDTHKPVRQRLGNREQSPDSSNRFMRDEKQTRSNPVRDRLGLARNIEDDADRVMERHELESQRPNVRPWEANPEFVPRSNYYFEHDNREDYRPNFDNRGRGYRGNRGYHHNNDRREGYNPNFSRGRRPYYNNYRGGGNQNYNRRGGNRGYYNHRRDSPEWKHDKYRDVNEEPSSTTSN